jgi:L-alanine-DL-glutamate epimerase-like enolase superfamily enzyme
MTLLKVEAWAESWPIAGSFVIARGAKREATVVVARLSDGTSVGHGECVPYARYGETVDSVCAAILAVPGDGLDRRLLAERLPAGAARNALDCALWDYQAKASGRPAAELAGIASPRPQLTALTISLDHAEAMAAAAARERHRPLLKLKLGGEGDGERLRRVRAACPHTRLIADANESWSRELVGELMAAAADTGIELIEQPLPADADQALAEMAARPVPVCADESCHTRADLERLMERYDAVNIKLDKAGGLTEALALAAEARARGFKVMVGSMLATSLSMAPATLLAQTAEWVDLDGPLLLRKDRAPGLIYEGALVHPPTPNVWG